MRILVKKSYFFISFTMITSLMSAMQNPNGPFAASGPLHDALARHNHLPNGHNRDNNQAVIFALLTAGADPNALSKSKLSPLHLITIPDEDGHDFQVLYALLLYGARVNVRAFRFGFRNESEVERERRQHDNVLFCLIHTALDDNQFLLGALFGDLDELRAYLPFNQLPATLNFALELAIGQGHNDVVAFLLAVGAVPTPSILARLELIINRPSTADRGLLPLYMEIRRLLRTSPIPEAAPAAPIIAAALPAQPLIPPAIAQLLSSLSIE